MPVQLRIPGTSRRTDLRAAVRLHLETLETRCLPSVTTWPGFVNPLPEAEPNDTLDKAHDLGDLSVAPRAEAVGTIGNGTAGPADVDWYSFQLDRPANVTLATPPAQAGQPAIATLSLYNSDPNDFNDPYNPLGYGLVRQADSAGQAGGARIEQRLPAGTYYVAVSGSGNHNIYPFLAGSGADGAMGDYGLLITAADLGLGQGDGPAVLSADPQPGAELARSPFMLRLDVSGPLNPNTVSAGGTVNLLRNVNGTFGDGTDQVVPLASATLSPGANKLLIAPAAPLAPGYYKLVLAGNSSTNPQVLAAPNGVPLGTSSSQSSGADFSYTFHVVSNEGGVAGAGTPDDTPAGAHELGDVSNLPLRQISGAIGDDSSDPIPFNPSDVDLYHFQIRDLGRHTFIAEVFAGRIGSPLLPGLSLFQADASGHLQLIGDNSGTLNDSPATNGSVPLFYDPVLYAGLTQGDYYLAVSGNGNVPDPVNAPPGTNGVFDPAVSHSGQGGFTTGPYLLNVHVNPDATPPQVVGTTPSEGDTFGAPPTTVLVQFSEPTNLQQLAYTNSQQASPGQLPAVYVLATNGTKTYPRLLSYDSSTQQAQFLMLDGLPNGTYELHLSGSGASGLTDLAGNPLVGNDPSGDYVVHFTVNGPVRGSNGNPLQWSDQEPNDSVSAPQDLGVLFPHELQTGVTITRNPSLNPGTTFADSADYYRFQVLQSRDYILSLNGTGLPPGTLPTLADAAGNPVPSVPQGTGGGVRVSLDSGTYVVGVGTWDPTQAPGVSYQLQVSLVTAAENPAPLTVGPAPAYRIALAFTQPIAPTTSPAGTPAVQGPGPSGPPSTPSTPPSPPSTSGPSGSTPTTSLTPTASQPTIPPVPPTNTLALPVAPGSPSTIPTTVTNTAPGPVVATPAAPQSTSATPTATSPPSVVTPAASSSSTGATAPVPASSAPAAPPSLSIAAPASNPVVAIPRLDLSTSAEAINNSGVLLIGNYRMAGEASSFVAIPSEVLTSLSALPVGGVRGTNRSDILLPSERLLARSAEPQIRLTILNQPSLQSDRVPEQETVTPAEQGPLTPSRISVPSFEDALRPSGNDFSALLRGFTDDLEEVWRKVLDNLFMNDHWQRRQSDWLERLPASSAPTSSHGENVPESTSESEERVDTALLNSIPDDAQETDVQPWAYAGLLFGIGAAGIVDDEKRRELRA